MSAPIHKTVRVFQLGAEFEIDQTKHSQVLTYTWLHKGAGIRLTVKAKIDHPISNPYSVAYTLRSMADRIETTNDRYN